MGTETAPAGRYAPPITTFLLAAGGRAGLLVAFQFVATAILPRVPYLTIADAATLWSFLVVASTLIMNTVNNRKYRISPEEGIRADRRCQVIYPVVYFSGLAVILLRRALL